VEDGEFRGFSHLPQRITKGADGFLIFCAFLRFFAGICGKQKPSTIVIVDGFGELLGLA
jgi:hypothetical protein